MAGEKILVVDDEKEMRDLCSQILDEEGYKIALAEDGKKAVNKVLREDFAVAIIDIKMPGMDGMEVLRFIKKHKPHIEVIMITGYSTTETAVGAMKLGAADYITKPFNIEQLTMVVKMALENRASRLENQQSQMEGMVKTLASTAEKRDPYTASHQRRVTQLACAIAKEMGLPKEQIEGIHVAGTLHDIGKICVPAEILSKPGPITESEFGIIKTHPQVGHDILKRIEFPWPITQIVLQHHERMDGSGYPQGLSGQDILLEARILRVADVVEAMSSHRPYRPAHGIDKALEEISKNKGVLYDSHVVEACLKLFTERRFQFK